MPSRKRTRNQLTPEILKKAIDQLEAKRPYAAIARDLKISAATLGRIRGAMKGNTNKNNQHIADMLKQTDKKTAPPARGKDTHGLMDELRDLQSDLARLQQRINAIREML